MTERISTETESDLSYIDENYVAAYELETYGGSFEQSRRARYQARRILEESMPAPSVCAPCPPPSLSLDEFVKEKEAGFTETLLSLIKKSGKKNSFIYKNSLSEISIGVYN